MARISTRRAAYETIAAAAGVDVEDVLVGTCVSPCVRSDHRYLGPGHVEDYVDGGGETSQEMDEGRPTGWYWDWISRHMTML